MRASQRPLSERREGGRGWRASRRARRTVHDRDGRRTLAEHLDDLRDAARTGPDKVITDAAAGFVHGLLARWAEAAQRRS